MDILEVTAQRVLEDVAEMRKEQQSDVLQGESQYSCPVCNDTGWEEYEKDGYTFCRECKCGIRRRMIDLHRMKFANIPTGFKEYKLSGFNVSVYNSSESREKARKVAKGISYYLNNFDTLKGQGKGLYLFSKTKGSGKTRMAVSLANEFLSKGIQTKFATSLQILAEIKKSWDKSSEYQNEGELISQLSSTEVLIIDDFDTEQSDKPWISERFYQIINSRYMDKKVTIYTSNSAMSELKYDERIVNRIKERSFPIQFPEESVRENLARQNMAEMENAIEGD